MKNKNQSKRSNGFTLIELMVVVIILGILALTIIPQFGTATQDAKINTAKINIKTLKNALERFFITMDRYPTTEEGLNSLVDAPSRGAKNWRGPYIEELPDDPWGNPYAYRSPGQHRKNYDIWSRGADGADGGEGIDADITSWSKSK